MRLVLGAALLVSSATVASGAVWAATTPPAIDGSAEVSDVATRTGNRYAIDPNGCGFRAGLALDSPDDASPRLLLHRFDGDVSDDTRFELPASVDSLSRVAQTQDCTTALVYEGAGAADRYVLVDLQSGAVRSGRLGGVGDPFQNHVTSLPDGRFVSWRDVGNDGIETFDVLTGERIGFWTLRTVPGQPGAFSDDGDVFAWLRRDDPGDPDDPFRLRWFRVSEPSPFATAEVPVFPGQAFRVDLSPNGEYAIVEGPLPGVFLSRVIDQRGRTIADFTDTERSLRATFVDDDTILLCRFDGVFRADLAGNEQLIEAFPEPRLVPQVGGAPPIAFSEENSACVEALSSPGAQRVYVQRGI